VDFFGGLSKGNSQVTLDTNMVHYKQCRVTGTHGSSADDNRMALDLIFMSYKPSGFSGAVS
jgi:L-iditol 2-dehydrogenase